MLEVFMILVEALMPLFVAVVTIAKDLGLIWQTDPNGKPVNSPHYTERAVFDKNGLIRVSPEFKRYAGGSKPQAVYLRAEAPKTNTGPVKITLLASDAYLFN